MLLYNLENSYIISIYLKIYSLSAEYNETQHPEDRTYALAAEYIRRRNEMLGCPIDESSPETNELQRSLVVALGLLEIHYQVVEHRTTGYLFWKKTQIEDKGNVCATNTADLTVGEANQLDEILAACLTFYKEDTRHWLIDDQTIMASVCGGTTDFMPDNIVAELPPDTIADIRELGALLKEYSQLVGNDLDQNVDRCNEIDKGVQSLLPDIETFIGMAFENTGMRNLHEYIIEVLDINGSETLYDVIVDAKTNIKGDLPHLNTDISSIDLLFETLLGIRASTTFISIEGQTAMDKIIKGLINLRKSISTRKGFHSFAN